MITKISLVRVLVATAFLVLTACSGAEKKPEHTVTLGMDKATVLEALGTPKKTNRVHGSDRWIYEKTSADGKTERTDVYFQEGKVSYIGAPRPEDVKVLKSSKGFKDVTGEEPKN